MNEGIEAGALCLPDGAIDMGGCAPPVLVGPKPRRKRQPTAQAMREQLAASADEVIRLKGVLAAQRPAWMVFALGALLGIGLTATAWGLS